MSYQSAISQSINSIANSIATTKFIKSIGDAEAEKKLNDAAQDIHDVGQIQGISPEATSAYSEDAAKLIKEKYKLTDEEFNEAVNRSDIMNTAQAKKLITDNPGKEDTIKEMVSIDRLSQKYPESLISKDAQDSGISNTNQWIIDRAKKNMESTYAIQAAIRDAEYKKQQAINQKLTFDLRINPYEGGQK